MNNLLTVGLPKRFDYLIVYHEQHGADQNRGQYRSWDEMEMRREEHDGQKYQTSGVYVGQRRLDTTSLAQGTPSERTACGHRHNERPCYVAHAQSQHLLCRLYYTSVS